MKKATVAAARKGYANEFFLYRPIGRECALAAAEVGCLEIIEKIQEGEKYCCFSFEIARRAALGGHLHVIQAVLANVFGS